MSAKPETTFIASIHRKLDSHVYRVKMNNPYAAGIPDVWYSGVERDLWVEYKYLSTDPKTRIVDPTTLLSALQLDWLNCRHAEGRNVAVIIGCPAGGVLLRNGEWNKHITADRFMTKVASREATASWITQFCGVGDG